ncbi:hypothetical protein ACFWBX_02435 [Streptomyces sp. NPDC059991]|uniref:hypothetical protein n=1 Tax=Streptomyces sp. NPDC059991 TaxID=3347028 RepID=UPI0036917932
MEVPDLSVLRRPLVNALAVLAADAPVQAAWVDRHGVMVDEIALDFDHTFRTAGRLIEHRQLSADAVTALRQIDALLVDMSGQAQADRWTRDALAGDSGWSRARHLARQVLIELSGKWDHNLPDIQAIR